MNRLLVICGQTATGKTSLALELARKLNGELISADSRQIYKYMDVVTGKDLPNKYEIRNTKYEIAGMKVNYYTDGSVKLWGYDIVRPDKEFSVSHYQTFSHEVIKDIYSRNKLPIVVGGTGLYIKSIVEPLDDIHFPVNKNLRSNLSKLSMDEMFHLLLKLDPSTAMSLNNSDRNNPRRLIRRLEIAQFNKLKNASDLVDKDELVTFDDVLMIGLMVSNRDKMKEIINERVHLRLGDRMDNEIKFLAKNNYLNYVPSRTIGYCEWIGYLNGEYSKEEAVEKWKVAETSYAKRQMTWFRKQDCIHWIDVLDKDWKKKVEKMTENWHNRVDSDPNCISKESN